MLETWIGYPIAAAWEGVGAKNKIASWQICTIIQKLNRHAFLSWKIHTLHLLGLTPPLIPQPCKGTNNPPKTNNWLTPPSKRRLLNVLKLKNTEFFIQNQNLIFFLDLTTFTNEYIGIFLNDSDTKWDTTLTVLNIKSDTKFFLRQINCQQWFLRSLTGLGLIDFFKNCRGRFYYKKSIFLLPRWFWMPIGL